MVVENEAPPFGEWFQPASLNWLLVIGSLAVVALLLALLVAVLRYGPVVGPKKAWRTLVAAVVDIMRVSPRRVWALAWLAVKESIRRRVVVGFAVFVLVLLFAIWFLDPGTTHPARLYISFVLTATSYLVLLLALFLSAFSLPADIHSRTLHTVVTKPVRPSEVVLGRILGFTIICTALLAVMCVISYFFVVRGLNHTHTLTLTQGDLRQLRQSGDDRPKSIVRRTDLPRRWHAVIRRHSHQLTIFPSGNAEVAPEHGHWHQLDVQRSGKEITYRLGQTKGMFQARVPVHGKISFRDRKGIDTSQGISIGDEWAYRSYIEGATQAAAIWTFQGINKAMFPDGLPVEMTIGVFRTFKGEIERGILGSLSVRNPQTGLTVEVEIFESKEFATERITVPQRITKGKYSGARMISRKVETDQGVLWVPPPDQIDQSLAKKDQFDLFEELVSDDGKVEIWLQCLEPGQYFGAAQADLYLRAADAWFWLNFLKGYFGIWLQMVLVVGFGVMFSTVLSGPVAMMATLGVLVGGFFSGFMRQLAFGETFGGGPLESLIRLLSQQNLLTRLNPSLGAEVAQTVDVVLQYGLRVASAILPPFGQFSFTDFVAYGFDISTNLILVRSAAVLGFLVPVFVIGHFCFKMREIAR